MEVLSLTRNARMSPKKMRDVARIIQGRKAAAAVDYLTLIPRKSARLIVKTLKSAIANAENNNNLSADDLTIKSAIIENGPVLKRFKAGARGTAKPRKKKMSHIRIVLTDGNTNLFIPWAKKPIQSVSVLPSVATGSLACMLPRRTSASSSSKIT